MMKPEPIYLCIKLEKNSIIPICKDWSNEELRPIMQKIMFEDPELQNLIKKIVQDSFNKALIEVI
jgi:hypothetical protein